MNARAINVTILCLAACASPESTGAKHQPAPTMTVGTDAERLKTPVAPVSPPPGYAASTSGWYVDEDPADSLEDGAQGSEQIDPQDNVLARHFQLLLKNGEASLAPPLSPRDGDRRLRVLGPGLKAGKLADAHVERRDMPGGIDYRISLDKDEVVVSIRSTADLSSCAISIRRADASQTLTFQEPQYRSSDFQAPRNLMPMRCFDPQELQTRYAAHASGEILRWAGDLDGDHKIDLWLEPPSEFLAQGLFLSSVARDGQVEGLAGYVEANGC